MSYQSQKRHALVARERREAVLVVPVVTVMAPEKERLTTLTCNGNDYVRIFWNNYIDVWTGFILITL
ncbi:Piso0_004964 [Millerozyma farinosa CBS 7064]|uniref:Piso0_004964 protein n=1 Tax=Pichia sorbitophila (strain ATCC MYA-4447 / BCRC 22081 / CBS 7064 / NBRC 10061 / NRRL Y-12695) TaxID=559304 RepID=G8Y0X0_PICSO|nr:Piso0_004964 [Millerozyma farinosa CBS 7064]